jgi:hypothetical protein
MGVVQANVLVMFNTKEVKKNLIPHNYFITMSEIIVDKITVARKSTVFTIMEILPCLTGDKINSVSQVAVAR